MFFFCDCPTEKAFLKISVQKMQVCLAEKFVPGTEIMARRVSSRKQLQYLFPPKLHHATILTSTQNKLPPS
jgi:hypothetical protein